MRRRNVATALFVAAVACLMIGNAQAQVFRGGAVGGVLINTNGVLEAPTTANQAELLAKWQAGLAPVPADLQQHVDLRFVSLRGIEQQLAAAKAEGKPVPESVQYLAGLLRVRYVLIYPPEAGKPGDIVLAGPAEGWRVDALGNTVGQTTGRPVLMLEDLMVALRTTEQANGAGISCSIDPTAEGIANVQRVNRTLKAAEGPQVAARKLEKALGDQVVTVSGVPTTSHFARSLVAADFRMKRLAMDFEPAPVSSLPSYLDLIPERSTRTQNMLPRWWLATNYEPVGATEDGLAWEIRGQGVKCMTEESVADEAGQLRRTGKASPFAQKWADMMTSQFEELANHDSAFGHLRNAMDLSVAAAIIAKEDAMVRAQLETPLLAKGHEIEKYPAPRKVASRVSFVRKRGKWILSASGGVQMYPWEVADRIEQDANVGKVHSQAVAANATNWWWQ